MPLENTVEIGVSPRAHADLQTILQDLNAIQEKLQGLGGYSLNLGAKPAGGAAAPSGATPSPTVTPFALPQQINLTAADKAVLAKLGPSAQQQAFQQIAARQGIDISGITPGNIPQIIAEQSSAAAAAGTQIADVTQAWDAAIADEAQRATQAVQGLQQQVTKFKATAGTAPTTTAFGTTATPGAPLAAGYDQEFLQKLGGTEMTKAIAEMQKRNLPASLMQQQLQIYAKQGYDISTAKAALGAFTSEMKNTRQGVMALNQTQAGGFFTRLAESMKKPSQGLRSFAVDLLIMRGPIGDVGRSMLAFDAIARMLQGSAGLLDRMLGHFSKSGQEAARAVGQINSQMLPFVASIPRLQAWGTAAAGVFQGIFNLLKNITMWVISHPWIATFLTGAAALGTLILGNKIGQAYAPLQSAALGAVQAAAPTMGVQQTLQTTNQLASYAIGRSRGTLFTPLQELQAMQETSRYGINVKGAFGDVADVILQYATISKQEVGPAAQQLLDIYQKTGPVADTTAGSLRIFADQLIYQSQTIGANAQGMAAVTRDAQAALHGASAELDLLTRKTSEYKQSLEGINKQYEASKAHLSAIAAETFSGVAVWWTQVKTDFADFLSFLAEQFAFLSNDLSMGFNSVADTVFGIFNVIQGKSYYADVEAALKERQSMLDAFSGKVAPPGQNAGQQIDRILPIQSLLALDQAANKTAQAMSGLTSQFSEAQNAVNDWGKSMVAAKAWLSALPTDLQAVKRFPTNLQTALQDFSNAIATSASTGGVMQGFLNFSDVLHDALSHYARMIDGIRLVTFTFRDLREELVKSLGLVPQGMSRLGSSIVGATYTTGNMPQATQMLKALQALQIALPVIYAREESGQPLNPQDFADIFKAAGLPLPPALGGAAANAPGAPGSPIYGPPSPSPAPGTPTINGKPIAPTTITFNQNFYGIGSSDDLATKVQDASRKGVEKATGIQVQVQGQRRENSEFAYP